jgi:hypothetical protein
MFLLRACSWDASARSVQNGGSRILDPLSSAKIFIAQGKELGNWEKWGRGTVKMLEINHWQTRGPCVKNHFPL